MKIILRQDVERLGQRGDIITVKDGFARNYLIPRKLALVAIPADEYADRIRLRQAVASFERHDRLGALRNPLQRKIRGFSTGFQGPLSRCSL